MSGNRKYVWKRTGDSELAPVTAAAPAASVGPKTDKYQFKRALISSAVVPFATPPAAVMDPPVAGSAAPLKKSRPHAPSVIEPFSMKTDVFELNTNKLFFNHANCYCSIQVRMTLKTVASLSEHFTKYNWVKDCEYEKPKSPYHVSLIHPSFASVRGRALSEIVSEKPRTTETVALLQSIESVVSKYIGNYESKTGPILVRFPATKRLAYRSGDRTAVTYEAQFSDPTFMPGLKAHLSMKCGVTLSPEQSFHMTVATETKRKPVASVVSAPVSAPVFVAGAGAGAGSGGKPTVSGAAASSAPAKPFVPTGSVGFGFH